MISGEYDYLVGLARHNLCADHKLPLEVAWHSDSKQYVLRCGQDHYPDTVIKNTSLTTEAKRTASPTTPPMLNNLNVTDLGDGRLLTSDQVKGMVIYGQRYRLDAYRGHVAIMYGRPYITIDGYYYHLATSGKCLKIETQPLPQELRQLYMIPDGAHAWLCIGSNLETGEMWSGVGIVTAEEMTAKSGKNPQQLASPVVAKHPWQLAQKRAEWQMLRRADPIGETKEEV